MIRKFFCRRSESGDQCVIQRTDNEKTFSSFVDEVTRDYPRALSSEAFPLLPINSNNPYDVLQNKGLLNISPSSTQTKCCPSNVKLNFVTEELDRNGQTLKVFQSDHHFKNGRLVYSSTQEVIPDRIIDFKRPSRWERNKGKVLSAGAGTRREYSKTLSSMNFGNAKEENRERYLHTLASQDIHKRRSSPRIRHLSPGSFKYLASYQEPWYPAESQLVKTSSKVSVYSKKTYSSPKGHEIKISQREENRSKTTTEPLPPPRFRRDLFVIPKHTCHSKLPTEAANYLTEKPSHRNTVRRDDSEASFKYETNRKITDFPIGQEYMQRTEISHIASPHDKYVKFSPRHRVRYVDDNTDAEKQKHNKKQKEGSFYKNIIQPCYQVYTVYRTHEDKNKDGIKSGKHKHPVKESFMQESNIRGRVVSASDEEHGSEESSRTLPFAPTDTEDAREFQKHRHKHRETSVKESEAAKILNNKSETKCEQTSDKKVRRRRQIDPNKVVHLEDTGKRFNQHFADGKVTFDSDRAFSAAEKNSSNSNYGICLTKELGCPKLPRNSNSKVYKVREESAGDCLKHMERMNDREIQAEIARNIVNNEALKEYREKYTKYFPREKTAGENSEWKSTVTKEYVRRTYVPEHCEACDIERFWVN